MCLPIGGTWSIKLKGQLREFIDAALKMDFMTL